MRSAKPSDILISDRDEDTLPVFHPEFGRFMLEATPGKPWGIGFKDLLDVEPNMKRRLVHLQISDNELQLIFLPGGESLKIIWKPTSTQ